MPMAQVFIPFVEQMKTVMELILHRLVLDLSHLDRKCKDLSIYLQNINYTADKSSAGNTAIMFALLLAHVGKEIH